VLLQALELHGGGIPSLLLGRSWYRVRRRGRALSGAPNARRVTQIAAGVGGGERYTSGGSSVPIDDWPHEMERYLAHFARSGKRPTILFTHTPHATPGW